MLSIFFDELNVYYNFDELLQTILRFNLERADKKMLSVDCLKILTVNEQVYFTDGVNVDVRLVQHNECYVSFIGVMCLLDSNTFGDKDAFENALVACTTRVVLNPHHEWLKNYLMRLRARVMASFDFYFKILEQYMLVNQPCCEEIGPTINKLIVNAEHYKHSNDYTMLIESYRAFDKASALMLKYIKQ